MHKAQTTPKIKSSCYTVQILHYIPYIDLSVHCLKNKNMVGFLLLIILIDNLSMSLSSSNNVTIDSSSQEATKRAWALGGLVRRFAFPPGTFIIFTPEITLPAWRDYEQVSKKKSSARRLHDHRLDCDLEDGTNAFSKEGEQKGDNVGAFKNSAIQIASPFYVYFDKLGWTHEDSVYNTPHHVASYIQEYMIDPALQIFGVPPPPPSTVRAGENNVNIQNRAGSLSVEKRKVSLSEIHRLQLFQKIESFLEELGAHNGKACLLRAICELNEFPFDAGRFGIFGEVLALVLGTELFLERETNQCLLSYSKAAQYGKARHCGSYAKFCQHSIFHWFWKMGQSYGVS